MKKIALFILIVLIFIFVILYSTYFEDFLSFLDEKKVYKMETIEEREINTLEEFEFFDRGILTYNNQRMIHMDYNNNIIWENQDMEFSNKVFTTENYIFRQVGKNITMTDRNNQQFIIPEIEGDIINVSRENDKISIISKGSEQNIFILNERNEVIVENKGFTDIITGLSISDKSEAYVLTTLSFEDGQAVNTIYFNLMEDIELWTGIIKNEILIKTKIVNNNVIVIGSENIYFYNDSGALMWKNSIYNKIIDYGLVDQDKKIVILFDKDGSNELISYNFQGKILEIQDLPLEITDLHIFDNKALVYNDRTIYLVHGNKADMIFQSQDSFKEILIRGDNIYILFKDKIIKGQIK